MNTPANVSDKLTSKKSTPEKSFKEEWKPIKGFEYEVSNKGRVRSITRTVRIGKATRKVTGRVLSNRSKSPYPTVILTRPGKRKTIRVHRLVALAFIPNPDNLPQVNHIDGNKHNNSLDNLEWCDASGNKVHAVDNGLLNTPKGKNHWNAKFKPEDILKIRKAKLSKDLKLQDIADSYNVKKGAISKIRARKSWKHVK